MKIFMVFSVLTFSHFCFSQDIDCNQFLQTITKKINDGFDEAIRNAKGNGCFDIEDLKSQNDIKMRDNCIKKIFEAEKYCDKVSLKINKKELSSAKGGSHASANGTKGTFQATRDFWEDNKKCGFKLAQIPPSCRDTARTNRNKLVSGECTPLQIENVKAQALVKAPPLIMKYCNALAKHYERAKQVITNRGVATRNLNRTNKKTFDRSGK